ncbi:hypothetical protein [Streptomyces sp. NPDC020298]|uniref:hypothetical protein n=1 Tax=unclassified Streptomyces TaxID=2593676 RepID=UPI0033DE190A
MTAYDAYLTARALADHGLDSDGATTADMDAAADLAGAPRPDGPGEQAVVRMALDAITT